MLAVPDQLPSRNLPCYRPSPRATPSHERRVPLALSPARFALILCSTPPPLQHRLDLCRRFRDFQDLWQDSPSRQACSQCQSLDLPPVPHQCTFPYDGGKPLAHSAPASRRGTCSSLAIFWSSRQVLSVFSESPLATYALLRLRRFTPWPMRSPVAVHRSLALSDCTSMSSTLPILEYTNARFVRKCLQVDETLRLGVICHLFQDAHCLLVTP